jgi:hypothetical protein
MFLLLAVVFGCVVLCGCSSLETNRVGAQLTIKCELELEPVVEIREESVMGTGSASSFMGIVNWGASTRARPTRRISLSRQDMNLWKTISSFSRLLSAR